MRRWADLLFDEPVPLSMASLPVASRAATMADGGADHMIDKIQ